MLLTRFLNKTKMIKNIISGLEVCKKTLLPVLFIWIIYGLQHYGIISIDSFKTSSENGLWSILTGPLLHGSLSHIVGNTGPMLMCLSIIARFYNKEYYKVLGLGFIFPSLLMYYIGVPTIGISGLGYTLIFFVISAGIFSEDIIRFGTGMLTLIIWGGGLIGGATVLAGFGIAWQSHLYGLIIGLVLGVLSIKVKL